MERTLTVLIIEDDTAICQRLAAEIEETRDITLVNITNSSLEALELVKEQLPDAIILDLDLGSGCGNGFEFLQEVKKIPLSIAPYILVTTSFSSSNAQNFAKDLGADFIFFKHQADYTEKKAVAFLEMMRPLILKSQHPNNLSTALSETPAQKNQRIRRLITTELDYVGINPKSVGYQYLIDAILIAINDAQPNIATAVSQIHKKTPASVERGIQNAISRAWHTMDINELSLHYTAKINPDRGMPTLTEFIYYYANKIKNMCK